MRPFMTACVVVLLAFFPAGCDEDEAFPACPMSPSILEACRDESPSTALTCVVAQHPMCDEQICAMWENSEPFCTRACEQDGDCRAGSSCQSYLSFDLCVPDGVVSLQPSSAPGEVSAE